MKGLEAYITSDGSVGLYSNTYKDVYHSATGALTEAYEKFIYPINWDTLLNDNDVKILDICYGIGYNTKSFLNYIFENKKKLLKRKNFLKNNFPRVNTEAIHTDNNLGEKTNKYNAKIYTDNIFNKLSVTAIDNDKILCLLSPFINTGIKNFKNDKKIITSLGIEKYFSKNENSNKINNLINFQILSKLVQNTSKIVPNDDISQILYSSEYKQCFNEDIKGIFNYCYQFTPDEDKVLNLHNIYYRYLSLCYKMALKYLKIQDFTFNLEINDARLVIMNDVNLYNLIFLDAFTPSKCPCLWSYEFFKQLFNHLKHDGMLLTYSSSAKIRSAMIEAGFKVGKFYNSRLDKFQGTVAVKDENLLKYKLSEFDLGLLKTKAGIFYRDKDLTASNEAIIMVNQEEIEVSNKISSSQYMKLRRSDGI